MGTQSTNWLRKGVPAVLVAADLRLKSESAIKSINRRKTNADLMPIKEEHQVE